MERVKFTSEFLFRSSPEIMYKFLTTPDCLARWFCDEVAIQDDVYTFIWNGAEETAQLIEGKEGELLRYAWDDAESDEEFLEFKFSISPVTSETIVLITDFCDEDEVDDQIALWETQMKRLRSAMGG